MKPTVILLLASVIISMTTATSSLDFFGTDRGSSSSSSSAVNGGDKKCFCQLEGKIDDCLCNVDTVDYFNNMKIFPRLQSLLHKPYFRYFQYNANKPCPFWDNNSDKCASSSCGVRPCRPEEIPPGLKGLREMVEVEAPHHKYSEKAQTSERCSEVDGHSDDDDEDSRVDDHISEVDRESLQRWRDHDDSLSSFCDVAGDQCPDCEYVDLTINPERFTGYSGEAARKIWRAVYEENCFKPPNSSVGSTFSAAFLQDSLEDLCLEKRAFYRAVSGLHASITIHLCANYLLKKSDAPFVVPIEKFGPNLDEFQQRFDPVVTNHQGPFWLKNLYFVYLLELRALTKVAPFLESQSFYTGKTEEDKETQIAVKELLNLMRSFPDQFDERVMFTGGPDLKEEFRLHFLNISRVMDCVSCDKCKLWGKLQVTGLGTALKILFADDGRRKSGDAHGDNLAVMADELQRLRPPDAAFSPGFVSPDFKLSRNEIVALFNAFGKIATSIQQLERFREMLR